MECADLKGDLHKRGLEVDDVDLAHDEFLVSADLVDFCP